MLSFRHLQVLSRHPEGEGKEKREKARKFFWLYLYTIIFLFLPFFKTSPSTEAPLIYGVPTLESIIKTLSNFLNKNCPSFNEDFELIKFISTGGTGVVYEGQMRKKKNKQKLAFKFKYSKKQNTGKNRN